LLTHVAVLIARLCFFAIFYCPLLLLAPTAFAL
jgi:hypothetical protein